MTSPTPTDLKRYKENWQAEIEAAAIYRAMAAKEPSAKLKQLYERLAQVEDKHAALWEAEMAKAGEPVPKRSLGFRARFLLWLSGRFGPAAVLPSMAKGETADFRVYDNQSEASGTTLAADERSHARILNLMTSAQEGGRRPMEPWHRTIGGNALRAGVLGANDGLVSNLSLVMGVAGAQMSPRAILVTGVAGLLAGACSMAIGEWISVQSSRELNERQISMEDRELTVFPEEEKEELRLIFQAKGLSEEQARLTADKLFQNKDKALDTLVREELGIDPHELGGSAWEAAWTSFVLFAAGAIVPLFPFFFLSGIPAIVASVAASAAALFVIGAAITLVTGRPVLRSGLRQLAFGVAAAGVTYALGHLFGVNIGG